MGQGGPTAAATVCAAEAQDLSREAAQNTGVAVGRSSLELRNPENAGPAWVRAWLQQQGKDAADAQPMSTVEDGKARFIAPIAIEGVCLGCHGADDAISAEVREILTEHYPNDRATGYDVGDLRGAIWAEADVGGT